MKLFVICALLLLPGAFSYDSARYKGYKVYQVTPRSLTQALVLKDFEDDDNFDFWTDIRSINLTVDIMVSALHQSEFETTAKKENIIYSIIIEDLSLNLQDNSTEEEIGGDDIDEVGGHVTFLEFMRHDDINAYLKQLAQDYSDIVTIESIGKSFEGRNMILIRISSGGSNKPVIYIQAAIHAREWIAPPVALYIINQLVENSDNIYMYDKIDWVILPVVNPDGYEYTHTNDRFWRKTRSASSTCYGADANRNFDAHWGELGSSSWQCDYMYHGEAAFSEPETRAVRDYILRHKNNIKLFIDLHSYGRLFLHPYGYSDEIVDNLEELQTVGTIFSSAVHKVNGTDYTVNSFASGLYYASGTSVDWVKANGINLAYTLELPKGGSGFNPPASSILPVVRETWEGFKALHTYIENKFATK